MNIIFVDGYNVLNSWPELKKIKNFSFEDAREKLIEMLQNYSSFKGCKLFLVFDAHLVNGSTEKREKKGNMVIVFTKEGEIADNYIERCVNNIGRKFDVCVVTSDSLEQQIAFQRGATRMSSIEFYNEVKGTEKKIKKCTEEKFVNSRFRLEDRINSEIVKKLEKIRKST